MSYCLWASGARWQLSPGHWQSLVTFSHVCQLSPAAAAPHSIRLAHTPLVPHPSPDKPTIPSFLQTSSASTGSYEIQVPPISETETYGGVWRLSCALPSNSSYPYFPAQSKHWRSSHLTMSALPGSPCTCFPAPNTFWCLYRKDEDKNMEVIQYPPCQVPRVFEISSDPSLPRSYHTSMQTNAFSTEASLFKFLSLRNQKIVSLLHLMCRDLNKCKRRAQGQV